MMLFCAHSNCHRPNSACLYSNYSVLGGGGRGGDEGLLLDIRHHQTEGQVDRRVKSVSIPNQQM